MITHHQLTFGVGGRPPIGKSSRRTLAEHRYLWHVARVARVFRDRYAPGWPLDSVAYYVTVRHSPLVDKSRLRMALADALTGVLWRDGAAVAWSVVADESVGDGIMISVTG